MANNPVYVYEGMFLLSQAVAADFGGAIDHIRELIAKAHGEILAMKKWDERRLAYEIKGQKRGVYILVYFKAPGGEMARLERDCNLSEKILRSIVLRADHLTSEEIQAFDARKELEVEAKMRASQVNKDAPAPAAQPAGEA
ncbi:MAG: 30S ribosomal protein S6 [Planctomycetota bacterium]|nr:30S ribosomal protein S6 [Planctomycetota bacterium]